MLADSGFDLMLWEDHTKYLAELTAKLILSDLSIEEFFSYVLSNPKCSCVKADIKAAKLGYFMLIAKKKIKELIIDMNEEVFRMFELHSQGFT
jgi:hypothetical protein